MGYAIVNHELIKLIDFKRMKRGELKKHICRGILLSRLTLHEVVQRIRAERDIDPKDFLKVYIIDVSTDRLYDYISN